MNTDFRAKRVGGAPHSLQQRPETLPRGTGLYNLGLCCPPVPFVWSFSIMTLMRHSNMSYINDIADKHSVVLTQKPVVHNILCVVPMVFLTIAGALV